MNVFIFGSLKVKVVKSFYSYVFICCAWKKTPQKLLWDLNALTLMIYNETFLALTHVKWNNLNGEKRYFKCYGMKL